MSAARHLPLPAAPARLATALALLAAAPAAACDLHGMFGYSGHGYGPGAEADLYTAPDPAEEARGEQARLEAIASARRAFLARFQVQPTPPEAATAAAPAPAATPPEAH